MEFYRTGGNSNPYSCTKFTTNDIKAEVDFFQLPCPPPPPEEEKVDVGREVREKLISTIRAGLNQKLYTFLINQIKQALFHAAEQGRESINIQFYNKGQTSFGQDAFGDPLYIVMNVGCEEIFSGDARKKLLIHDLKALGIKVTTALPTQPTTTTAHKPVGELHFDLWR